MRSSGSWKGLGWGVFLLAAGVAHGEDQVQAAAESPSSDSEVLDQKLEVLLQKRKHLEDQERQLTETLRAQAERLKDQQRAVESQSQLITEQKRLLDEQRRRFDQLRVRLEDLGLPPVEPEPAASSLKQERPAAPPSPDGGATPAPLQVGQAPPIVDEAPRQAVDLIEGHSILTRKGTLIVEPGLQYSQSGVTRIGLDGVTLEEAILIGLVDVKEVDRDTVTLSLGMRYGLLSRVELEGRIPFVRREDRVASRPISQQAEDDVVTKTDGTGIGDLEGAMSVQLNGGREGYPYVVFGLRAKAPTGRHPFEIASDPSTGLLTSAPTGTGFWSVQPGLTISFPSDPAVFYGALNYLWNIERDFGGSYGKIDAGDAVGISFGTAVALNQAASLSFGYSHSVVQKSTQNGVTLSGSDTLQVGTLLVGASHRVGRKTSLSVTVAIGATEDAPNLQVSLRLPTGFALFE